MTNWDSRLLKWRATLIVALVLGPCFSACRHGKEPCFLRGRKELRYYTDVATKIDYPDVKTCENAHASGPLPPRTLSHNEAPDYWPLTLEEAVQIALANSRVLRDLGGRTVSAPGATRTVFDPAIQEADPRFGVEGALSAFDASFAASTFWERNDRFLNNNVEQGIREFQQEKGTFTAEINKRAATGGQFAVRNRTLYDGTNSPNENIQFRSAWTTMFEAEVRQPFLQGGGIAFNRIAGPNPTNQFQPARGVVLARLNTDITLADFEAGVIALVSDVENAYWDLYYAYRDLDVKRESRDRALETWRAVNAQVVAGVLRGEADREAQAREQYYFFENQVHDALSGTPRRGTQSGVGSSGGVFSGSGGVYASERKLRAILGLPVNDGRLIRPGIEPPKVRIVFDWHAAAQEALARRVELRRQKWQVRRSELELIAARNYLKPRLDGVALYRWRGSGDDLIDPDRDALPRFDNAFQMLTGGDFQEWQLGFQLNVPIGYRQAAAAVRNAELKIARTRAILSDQELQVSHDLSEAVAEIDRAYVSIRTNFNRLVAAQQQMALLDEKYRNPPPGRPMPIEFLLDAQRRLTDAELTYYRALVEYALAVKNVHLEKGSLLDYNEVLLAEGPWPHKAYSDARKRARERTAALPLNYGCTSPGIVTRRAAWQQTEPAVAPVSREAPLEELPVERPDELPPQPGQEPLPPPEIEPDAVQPASLVPSVRRTQLESVCIPR